MDCRQVKRMKVTNFTYSSPNIIQSSGGIFKEDDYFSVGMILLEMCMGSVPFDINEYFTIEREKMGKLFRGKKYSKELIEIITNLLIERKVYIPADKFIVKISKRSREVKYQYSKVKRINFESIFIIEYRL